MYDAIKMFHKQNKSMQFKIIPKFPEQGCIFTEVIVKKNIKQTDRQIYHVRIRKFLERDDHEAEINPTKKKFIKIGTLFEKIQVYKH